MKLENVKVLLIKVTAFTYNQDNDINPIPEGIKQFHLQSFDFQQFLNCIENEENYEENLTT